MIAWLQGFFYIEENGSTLRREVSGGVVTFLTMSYIVFVQPAILSQAGIPLTYSIADGLALGFVSYTFIKLLSGRRRDLNLILVLVTIVFILRFVLIRF